MSNQNPWDALAPSPADEIHEPTEWYDADNPYLAEPIILDYLASQMLNPKDTAVLDFGCGDGRFAHRLKGLGYDVEGMDAAAKMVEAAKATYGTAVKFYTGGLDALPNTPTYDIITSIMVLQFIPNFIDAIQRLAVALKAEGFLIIAVFNPAFMQAWLTTGDPHYVGFDSVDNPTKGTLLFGEIAVPTYIRSAAQYNQVAVQNGLSPTHEAYPPFNHDFLAKFPVDGPTEYAEHMILCYKKQRS
jgi:2-polyprenyl-3-methyl-5-hydroxy-6-metoxy-1,4-benzoquinol methylase